MTLSLFWCNFSGVHWIQNSNLWQRKVFFFSALFFWGIQTAIVTCQDSTALKIHPIRPTWATCFPFSACRASATTDAVVWACPFLFFSLYYLSLPNTGLYPNDTGIRCRDLTLIGANSCLHIPPSHLNCMQQNSGLRGEKSWAWISSQNFTLNVWTCLLKFKCKLCCERSQRHDWNIGAEGCHLVPHFKWGSIKSKVPLAEFISALISHEGHRDFCGAAFSYLAFS